MKIHFSFLKVMSVSTGNSRVIIMLMVGILVTEKLKSWLRKNYGQRSIKSKIMVENKSSLIILAQIKCFANLLWIRYIRMLGKCSFLQQEGNICLTVRKVACKGKELQIQIAVGRRKARGKLDDLVSRFSYFLSIREVSGMVASRVSLFPGEL